MKLIEDLDDLVQDGLYFIYNRAEGKELYAGRFEGASFQKKETACSKDYIEFFKKLEWDKEYLFFQIEFDSCQLNNNYEERIEMDDEYFGSEYLKQFEALEFMSTLLIFKPEPQEVWFLI